MVQGIDAINDKSIGLAAIGAVMLVGCEDQIA
jgi:hypothetical protein